ncbi:helix-turn-helix transcriptional regulator [Corynebacterium lactis]|uniref:helix-turn-helix transcriptional regulator n=1 Tax=Corynebacterium lactis TaxID=1231000 RepID=UPI000A5C4D63|nr:hypothetical protein [Corynebacterium lactis]
MLVVVDTTTGDRYWIGRQCADHIGVQLRTWLSYVSRGQAPAPSRHLNSRTALWAESEVIEWAKNRPRSSR